MTVRVAPMRLMLSAILAAQWPQAATAANAANAAGGYRGGAHAHHVIIPVCGMATSPCRKGCIGDIADCREHGCRWYVETFGEGANLCAATEPFRGILGAI